MTPFNALFRFRSTLREHMRYETRNLLSPFHYWENAMDHFKSQQYENLKKPQKLENLEKQKI